MSLLLCLNRMALPYSNVLWPDPVPFPCERIFIEEDQRERKIDVLTTLYERFIIKAKAKRELVMERA